MAYKGIDSVSRRGQGKESTIFHVFFNIKPSGSVKSRISNLRIKKQHLQKLTSAYLMLLMVFQGLAAVFMYVPPQIAHAAASWYSDYAYRVKIPINASSSGAQTDYQVSITLHSKTGTNTAGDIYLNSHLQDATTFNDIRFTASDSATLKSFWIEKIEDETDGRKATVWVKLNTPATGATDYYIYYGKAGDTNASSYDNTFTKDYGEEGLVGLWHMDEQTPGSELLTDGGLENWTDPTALANWTSDGVSAGIRDITQESTNKQAGSSSLKLNVTNNTTAANIGVWQDIVVASAQDYQINLYQWYAARTAAAGTLKIEAYDNTNSVSLGSQSIITQGTALSYTSFRFTTAATTASVKIKIYLNAETAGTAYIDSLSVKQSSKTLTDSSGNSNTGTINGASRTTTDGGQWGNRSDVIFSTGSALQFDGKDDYANAGNDASLNNQDFTIEFWANNLDPIGTRSGVVGTTGYSSNLGIGLYINSGNDSNLWIGNGTTLQFVSSLFSMTNGFSHYAVTKSGHNIYAYKNGILTKTDTASITNDISYAATSWQIGQSINQTYNFNGLIDDVRIYNRALSSTEISRQYIRSKHAFAAPLWSASANEEQLALGVSTHAANVSTVTTISATLNGSLIGFGGDTAAIVYFKYGLTSGNLNQTTATQVVNNYGSFSQGVMGFTADTTYYFQAVVADSAGIAYGSILSFQTAAFDTDYYRTIVNTDGSLTFVNKDTGATILNSSPQYNLNYGSTTDISKNPANNSFEIDNNSDSVPDGWAVANLPYLKLSTEQASDGSKSLKFNMTTADSSHRSAFSSLLTTAYDKYYTVTVDSYLSSFNSDSQPAVYIYYYDTVDGTGTQYFSQAKAVPVVTGSWHTLSFDWIPPVSAKSFRILLYSDKSIVAAAYLDNVTVTEKNLNYNSNGTNIVHTIVSNGSSYTVTAVDDSNPYARITH